jgi:hypothetical protein
MPDNLIEAKPVVPFARSCLATAADHPACRAGLFYPDCGMAGLDHVRQNTQPRWRRLVVVLILIWCHGSALAATNGAARLAKVRVARDGRTFVNDFGKPFVPFGVNYYRPGTGWAPQVWKQFDAEATRQDFVRMKELGVNCVRIFLTYHSFYTDAGVLREEGLAKFDKFLALAENAGIYVHPTGPDHWEGPPNWKPVSSFDEQTLAALEQFWKLFAARYRGRNVIFAYDLKNEPEIGWKVDIIGPQWDAWLERRYGTAEKLAAAWGRTNLVEFSAIPIPPTKNGFKERPLLDFQAFREDLADRWTSRQAAAIREVDPTALVSVGFLQTSVPSRYWGGIEGYTGFRPERQAKFLDFLEIHFYPSERGGYEYRKEEDELANLAYLEGIVREVASAGKPVVLAEFGWYGGEAKPRFDKGVHPAATEEQQARYCQHVIETSAGFVTGWLNWGLYDQPEATDCSEQTGLLTATGKVKAWGRTFQDLSRRFTGRLILPASIGARPPMDWEACLTSTQANKDFRQRYFEAFMADRRVTAGPKK